MADTSFASLNPSLLARKGGAKPAMRRQAMASINGAVAHGTAPNLEDLGWNDMGENDQPAETTVTPITSILTTAHADTVDDGEQTPEVAPGAKPVVHEQQDQIAEIFAKSTTSPRTARLSGKRAAFTLRLDAERHLRLRLASTVQNRSAQIIVTEALDALLADIPELESLAGQIRPKKFHKEGTQL